MKFSLHKSLLSIILFLSSLAGIYAQGSIFTNLKNPVDIAQRYYDNQQYDQAIPYFHQGIEENKNIPDIIKLQLGECYFRTNNQKQAAKWLSEGLKSGGLEQPKFFLFYAEVLSSQGKYTEAGTFYTLYRKNTNEENRPKNKLEGIYQLNTFFEDTAFLTVNEIVTPEKSDIFSPYIYKNQLYAVGTKSGHPGFKGGADYDLFKVDIFNNDFVKTELPAPLNTKDHEGPMALYNQGTKVIFTRTVSTKEKPQGVLQLFSSELISESKEKWSTPKALSFNNGSYSCGHPAISEDGQTLIFASDKPGGKGGMDLYISINRNGEWSVPVNMGDEVNTEGHELFPLIIDQTLYFTGNGHGGLGGMDIYRAIVHNTQVVKVENMGAPINSPNDDFGISIYEDGRKGYFSSNRPTESGNGDKIFGFKKTLVPSPHLSGIIMDFDNNLKVRGAEVVLMNEAGEVIEQFFGGRNAQFRFELERNQTYRLVARRKGFASEERVINTSDLFVDNHLIKLPLVLESLLLQGVIRDKKNSGLIDDAKVILVDETNGHYYEYTTGDDGMYDFILEDGADYSLFVTKEGFFEKTLDIETFGLNYGLISYTVDMNPIVSNEKLLFDDIIFEDGTSDLTESAITELNNIAKILNLQKFYKIKFFVHTDSRGDATTNMQLSQERARKIKNHLVSKGIEKDRIEAKGLGETEPVNQCVDGVECTEPEYMMNIRVEALLNY
ncbi:OmpA family protein [Marinigracilibium pacificum]|uniref:OmpA family protein n=1 Tax=Marinigracilibium pacificum TaxID=2729599 RepID=A0A848IZZ9_9BACT|nr:OmpA family protein [Marinigracilibium pacificum]NMM49176.1 OmpA family protein [Marinigracilibium pacificum]